MKRQPPLGSGLLFFNRRVGIALFLLSASTLLFEVNLTRLFSVSQFYHFAFVVVSLALLGIGASGTYLAIFPNLVKKASGRVFSILSLCVSVSMMGAYLITNWLPFDSFSIAWDKRQVLYLVANYLALITPFFFSGLSVSILLSGYAKEANRVYAINLAGSSIGCLSALLAPSMIGGEGMVSLSSTIAGIAALIAWSTPTNAPDIDHPAPARIPSRLFNVAGAYFLLIWLTLLALPATDLGLRLIDKPGLSIMAIRLSPYKSLSYAMQYPGAHLVSQRWNAISRVDVVHSAGIRSLPGLSYRYLEMPPAQDGLLIDGDDLNPIILDRTSTQVFHNLPTYLAFLLRPQAKTLVLEPRGGVDILTALAGGASQVIVTEANPLILDAAAEIYALEPVRTVGESGRSFLNKSDERFDVIIQSLTSSYHPVRSGAYSLAEDYRYTLESYEEMLEHLNPRGILVAMRWLQSPPSESLRVFAMAVTALRIQGEGANENLAVLRGYNTATVFIKKTDFTPDEISIVHQFAGELAFDLDYLPGLQPGESNIYNILPNAEDYQIYETYLHGTPEKFNKTYPFDVSPTTDNRPFFSHFFKWEQAGQVLAEVGKTWQPFGGAGYFVLIALLALVSGLAAVLILLPLAVGSLHNATQARMKKERQITESNVFLYFGLIGIAYLFVEIPLIQRFILYLGNPAYAITVVLFSLLLFSGLGSQISDQFPPRWTLLLLALIILVYPYLLTELIRQTLGFSLGSKLVAGVIVLAPAGFFMGIPFPTGIRHLSTLQDHHSMIPWAWGINGAASVISSILAAILALSWGFSLVFYLGAASYAFAWLTERAMASRSPVLSPPQ